MFQWTHQEFTSLVCDSAFKVFALLFLCCQQVLPMTEETSANWPGHRRRNLISRGHSLISFFHIKNKRNPLTGEPHKHKVIFIFLPHRSIFSSSITHILTDSSPRGGGTVCWQDRAALLFARQDAPEKKGIVGEKGGEMQTSVVLRGRIVSLCVPAGCFHIPTSRRALWALMCLTQTVSASYLYWF